nr:Callose synthase 5 [Ipomoea batatas]GMC64359.1 Callose synthase 5 [Ipomoea batatas]GMC66566.1 Callose synthase 5 [Ipomoea batatas]GMC67888.1 Callose synthase 5 [Ipomoea batatas]
MIMEIGLERGFRTALGDMIIMQLQLAAVFFTFSLGTKLHYFGRTVLHGGAKYRATGRGFVVRHEKFAENYRMYSRSHFTKGLEIMILLIAYQMYGAAAPDSVSFLFLSFSMWFLVVSLLFAPFLFNPSGFEWQKIVDDWDDWAKWISNRGGIGVPATKSWESWWEEEQEHLQYTGLVGRICEVLLSFRFLIYQYGIVYQLHVANNNKSIMVYGLSWLVIVVVMIILKEEVQGRLPTNVQASEVVPLHWVHSNPSHLVCILESHCGRYFCQLTGFPANRMGYSTGRCIFDNIYAESFDLIF